MYEARQNKEKVSWRIDEKKKRMHNTMNFDTIQRYFDTSNYHYAAECWREAAYKADDLNQRLDLRTKRGDTYIDDLKRNLELKAYKAATTLVGEAYEVRNWEQPKGKSIVIGPGGSSGADLLLYESLKYGQRALSPAKYGEVKSASTLTTFLDGIANAYHERGQNYIIMYYPTDNELPLDQYEFQRNGIHYCICCYKYDEGTFGGKQYTYAASVELPDFGKRLYLYTFLYKYV